MVEDNTEFKPNEEYVYLERDKNLENKNIQYANTIKGRILAFTDTLPIKTGKILHKIYTFIKEITVVSVIKVEKGLDFLAIILYNEYCNKILRKDIKKMSESNNNKSDSNIKSNGEKSTKNTKNHKTQSVMNGIMGIATLFVVISIAHSAWVITQGTDDKVSLVMAAPMVAWASIQLIKQFYKQGVK